MCMHCSLLVCVYVTDISKEELYAKVSVLTTENAGMYSVGS